LRSHTAHTKASHSSQSFALAGGCHADVCGRKKCFGDRGFVKIGVITLIAEFCLEKFDWHQHSLLLAARNYQTS